MQSILHHRISWSTYSHMSNLIIELGTAKSVVVFSSRQKYSLQSTCLYNGIHYLFCRELFALVMQFFAHRDWNLCFFTFLSITCYACETNINMIPVFAYQNHQIDIKSCDCYMTKITDEDRAFRKLLRLIFIKILWS